MLKKRYTILAETANIENFDPNLNSALDNIKSHKARQGDSFDFELNFVFDGFVENFWFNDIINTFLHDILDNDFLFHYVYKSEAFCAYVKIFIKNLFNTTKANEYANDENYYVLDAFIETKRFGFMFFMPSTIMSKDKMQDLLMLGPDYLLGNFFNDQLFEHFLPYLYVELSERDLLQSKEFKNLFDYKMGLH